MIKTREETITTEMRIAALEAAVETLLLEREGIREELNNLNTHVIDSMYKIHHLESEAVERAEMVRIAEEKKREEYEYHQKATLHPQDQWIKAIALLKDATGTEGISGEAVLFGQRLARVNQDEPPATRAEFDANGICIKAGQ